MDLQLSSYSPDDSVNAELLMHTVQVALPALIASPKLRNIGWSCLSFVGQQFKGVCEGIYQVVPEKVKKVVDLTGKVLNVTGKVAYKGAVCFSEFLDFSNEMGTKDPQASIDKSLQRLANHHPELADFCEFLGEQGAQIYLQNAKDWHEKLSPLKDDDREAMHAIEDRIVSDPILATLVFTLLQKACGGLNWFLDFSQDLIAQTIKANVLHLLANLADCGFDPGHPFEDRTHNPFGRILSVIGESLFAFEATLAEIKTKPEAERAVLYHQVFQEMSQTLLDKLFPNGAEDIQLFHHTIPVYVLREQLWSSVKDQLYSQLAEWLERLYFETRPLEEEHPDWQNVFDQRAEILEANLLAKAPTYFLQKMIREQRARPLNQLQPGLEKWLEELEKQLEERSANQTSQLLVKAVKEDPALQKMGFFVEQYFMEQKENDRPSPNQTSLMVIKCVKELLLTDDPVLHKMGSFFEQYFMERILYNLSQFAPAGVETPFPLYILQQWFSGEAFTVMQNMLEGAYQNPQDCAPVVMALLAPFGLQRKESFPLPPSIKELVWPTLSKFKEEMLPSLALQNIPQFSFLERYVKHQRQLDLLLEDNSLTVTISQLAEKCVNEGVNFLGNLQVSIGGVINALLPDQPLTEEQQVAIDIQWEGIIANEPDNKLLQELKRFAQKAIEAVALQVCMDIYENYIEACAQEGLEHLFNEDDQPAPTLTFTAWLAQEVAKAFALLKVDDVSEGELTALKRSLELKNAIRTMEEGEQKQAYQKELADLWPILQPKFEYLTRHLLAIFNYQYAEKLPLPDLLKPKIGELLETILPKVFFEQTGDLILPLLEKRHHQELLRALPKGELILQGCSFIAQDLVGHFPGWFEGYAGEVPNLLANQVPEIHLTGVGRNYLEGNIQAIIQQKDPSFAPLWQGLEGYIEGMLLKVGVSFSQMSQEDWDKLKEKALQVKAQVANQTPQEATVILVDFADWMLDWLGIETQNDLFGIPPVLRDALYMNLKKKLGEIFLGVYQFDYQIRHRVIPPNPVEEKLPASEVAQALLSVTRFALDETTYQLTKPVEGKKPGIVYIYNPVNAWLEKGEQEGYRVAGLFKQAMAEQVPLFENVFDLLDEDNVQVYKHQIADWFNPLLTEKVLQVLNPILQKEKEGQALFDQALVMHLLPVITKHLKHLNIASKHAGGLNFENYKNVAGHELHAAVPVGNHVEAQKMQRQENFYKKQVDMIFQLIFPNGKEDILKVMPVDLPLTPEHLDPIWNAAKNEVIEQLPKALDSLFKEELLIGVFKNVLENAIESLNQPIEIKPSARVQPLTEAEKIRQREMDHQIGELVIEAAKFFDLPIDRIQGLPGWSKKIFGWESIEKSTMESIGAVMREHCNGDILAQAIQKAMKQAAEQKHVKKDENEKADEAKIVYAQLEELEKKIASRTLNYVMRLIGAHIRHATDIFPNPIINAIREAVLAVSAFVMVHFIGAPLRLFHIDRFVINRIHEFVKHTREKSVDVFSRPDLNENLVYRGVEAFEEVILN